MRGWYTGRLSLRQYILNKPTKLGIKVFLIADSITGYVWNWYVYSGAVVGRRANGVHNLIVDLTQDLHNRGHRLYYDSFFTFVPTVRYLATKGIASAGMLRKNRRLIPDDVKQAPDTLQRGETHFMRVNSLLCFVYRDKRDIRFLTNCHGNQIGENGRPEALISYNIFARGVDKANQSNSFYHFSHRSLKWYKTLFISLLETAISNAYCLYMFQNPNSSLKSLKFRERLASSLCQDYITERNQQSLTRANVRIIPGLHHLEIGDQKNCYICSTRENRVTTKFYCVECTFAVCQVQCFYILHTKLRIYTKRKERNLE